MTRPPTSHWAPCARTTALAPEAAQHLQQAVTLNPSHAAAHANLGFVLCFLDRPDEALPQFEIAMRLCPPNPQPFIWRPGKAASHLLAGHPRAALAASMDALSRACKVVEFSFYVGVRRRCGMR